MRRFVAYAVADGEGLVTVISVGVMIDGFGAGEDRLMACWALYAIARVFADELVERDCSQLSKTPA